MKSEENCGTCRYHQHEDINDGWVCVNDMKLVDAGVVVGAFARKIRWGLYE